MVIARRPALPPVAPAAEQAPTRQRILAQDSTDPGTTQQQLAALDPRDEGTSTLAQPPPPTDDIPDPPKGDPFSISWTGREPTSSYIRARPTRRLIGLPSIWLAAALAGVLTSLIQGWQQPHFKDGPGHPSWWPPTQRLGPVFLFLSGLIGIIALIFLLVNAAQLPYCAFPWSLKIGPPGIRTTGVYDSREYTWSQVQTFAVRRIYGLNGSSLTALAIKPMTGEKQPTQCWPNGWPYPVRAWVIAGGLEPVCVLGPMSDQQRTALNEALARYGHGKSDAEAWGE
ncbi:hypothetical protein [Streptomyces gilvosporeus]|uniref:hypothetical protein n=1 Tax=Streptomyces gilvosporeus TaxID=553510 RepID=UPI00131DAD4D|nr:hypothetical protein [Streptomyces gilvosporeus]